MLVCILFKEKYGDPVVNFKKVEMLFLIFYKDLEFTKNLNEFG